MYLAWRMSEVSQAIHDVRGRVFAYVGIPLTTSYETARMPPDSGCCIFAQVKVGDSDVAAKDLARPHGCLTMSGRSTSPPSRTTFGFYLRHLGTILRWASALCCV